MTTRKDDKLRPWQQGALDNERTPLPEFPGNQPWAHVTQTDLPLSRKTHKRLKGVSPKFSTLNGLLTFRSAQK